MLPRAAHRVPWLRVDFEYDEMLSGSLTPDYSNHKSGRVNTRVARARAGWATRSRRVSVSRGVSMGGSEPWVAASRAELLAGAESRVVINPGDARSGSVFERVTIDTERFFVKTVGYRTDWIMRVTGDRDLRTLKIWRAGIMRDVPPEIDHAVVGMTADGAEDNEDAEFDDLDARHR